MDIVSSWLDLVVKLILLTGSVLGIGHWVALVQSKNIFFPVISISLLPFFIGFKITEAIGKGSINSDLYWIIAIAINALSPFFLCQKSQFNVLFPKRKIQILEATRRLLQHHTPIALILGGFLVFFCARGLYLEYPSDAVIYLQRIGLSNQDIAGIDLSALWQYRSSNTFFSSLQQWLVGSDIIWRSKLTILAAMSCCLLGLATYRLANWIIQNQRTASLSVLLSIGFYGNLQISFYLYKVLQGSTLAMIAYLEALPLIYTAIAEGHTDSPLSDRRPLQTLLILSGLFWLMIDCHQEKLLYVIAVILSFSIVSLIKSGFSQSKKRILIPLGCFLGLTATFVCVILLPRDHVNLQDYLVTNWLTIGSIDLLSYWPATPNSSYILLDLVCLGLIVIILACETVSSKIVFIATVTLAPYLFFLNPLAVTSLLKLTHSLNLYRLMLGGVAWVFLPIACDYLAKKKHIRCSYLPVCFLALSVLPYAPIFGKVPHLLQWVPSSANGRDVQPVIEYLISHQDIEKSQSVNILSTPYVNSYLHAWPQFQVVSNRCLLPTAEACEADILTLFTADAATNDIHEYLMNNTPSVIILDQRDPLSYRSLIGKFTGHWSPELLAQQQTLLRGDTLQTYLENHVEQYELTFEQNGFLVYEKQVS